jgi:hypothetical protein
LRALLILPAHTQATNPAKIGDGVRLLLTPPVSLVATPYAIPY